MPISGHTKEVFCLVERAARSTRLADQAYGGLGGGAGSDFEPQENHSDDEDIPCLLAQVLIVSFCIPQTLEAGKEIRREMTWEQLPAFLESEKKVTVVLTDSGAKGLRSDSIHLENGHELEAIPLGLRSLYRQRLCQRNPFGENAG